MTTDPQSVTVTTSVAARASGVGHRVHAPLHHVAAMVFDSPLAILPEKLDVILHTVGPRLTLDQPALDNLLASHALRSKSLTDSQRASILAYDDWNDDDDPDTATATDRRPYRLTSSGVAVIPISGVLMKRGNWMTSLSGCSSYDSIDRALTAALDDSKVRALLLDIDSPGGTTHGCFELSDRIYTATHAKSGKPIWGVANDLAASAAYALASACTKLYVTRTAGVGSIGVFALHVDQSGLDERVGTKYTYIFAGDHKIDGNPHEPLSRSAKKSTQTEVDREYSMFTATVARNRDVAEKAVIDTQAEVYFAEGAIPLLADAVGSFDDCLAALTSKITRSGGTLAGGRSQFTGKSMAASTPPPPSSTTTVETTEGAYTMSTSRSELQARLAALQAEQDQINATLLTTQAGGGEGDEGPGKGKKAGSAGGTKACPACDGTGKDDDGEACDSCHGTGKVEKKEAKHAGDKKPMPKPDEDDNDDDEPEGKKGKKAALAAAASSYPAFEISSLCSIAGKPELAADYILTEKSVADVRADLLKRRSEASAALNVSGFLPAVSADAMDVLTKQAQALYSQSGGKVKLSACLERVISANPAIYKAYEDERAMAALIPGRFEQYVATMAPRMRGLGLSSTLGGSPSALPM